VPALLQEYKLQGTPETTDRIHERIVEQLLEVLASLW
jgi:hypothetical protein